MSIDNWIAIAGIIICTFGVGLTAWMFAMHKDMAVVKSNLDEIKKNQTDDRRSKTDDGNKVWDRLDNHAERITSLEARMGCNNG